MTGAMNDAPIRSPPMSWKSDPFLHLAGRLVPGGHVLPVRVYYEDTDFSGIVYHANYLKFMERARSDHLRLIGVVQGELFGEALAEAPGFAFVVRSMELQFVKPARIDDVLEVHTLARRGRRRLHHPVAEGQARRRSASSRARSRSPSSLRGGRGGFRTRCARR